MSDQGTEGLLSPYLRKRRINAVKTYLKGKVLDYGCGSGALATLIDSDKYLGVEIDEISLQKAKLTYPKYSFASKLPDSSYKFDTIVSLAVIEHVGDPVEYLRTLSKYLYDAHSSRIVITTPHLSAKWIHDFGASIGIFSKHANEEHEELLDRLKLESVGKKAGLKMCFYKRFFFGVNQIAIYSRGTQ
jgi:SAM-dependent methyltransferase